MRYLVYNGSHVDADTSYAEVEVMKMCMPLLSPASGIIQFEMSEGQAMQVNYVPNKDLDIHDLHKLNSHYFCRLVNL